MRLLNLKATNVFHKNYNTTSRIVVNQGGTRSSKTYSLAQLFVLMGIQDTGKTYTICRKTLPSLKATAYKDFFEILDTHNLYNPEYHNKTELTYKLNGNLYEFISIDMPVKIRGRKRNFLWLNEANEFTMEDYQQLILRTTERIFLDYNPSDEYHWIYENVLTRGDCTFIKSTYKDNPFLSEDTINEIERLRDLDSNYWKIYGLGERGVSTQTIFSNYNLIDAIPSNAKLIAYGLDFGYSNDPSALVGIYKHDNTLYADELIYKRKLTNQDLSDEFSRLGIDRRDEIICDCAEPKSIEELYRLNWNVKPSRKGADSINVGIDVMKRHQLVLTKRSINLIKEMRNYKYAIDKNNKVLNKTIDAFNHLIDAWRYVALNKLMVSRSGKYYIH